jgi:hypothetical protein
MEAWNKGLKPRKHAWFDGRLMCILRKDNLLRVTSYKYKYLAALSQNVRYAVGEMVFCCVTLAPFSKPPGNSITLVEGVT